MKFCLSLLFLAVLFQFTAARDIAIGDNLETTLTLLGKPEGTIELKEKTLLLYPEGEVVLRNDAVTEIDLMSESEFQAEQQRIKEQREEWRIQQARLAEAHKLEGESILENKRNNRAFSILPAKDRVDYWRFFQTRYPSVDASGELAEALESYESELAELRTKQRIAELEARVAQAEQEAASARLETERLKKETERARVSSRYGLRYYHDPVVQPRYSYRPTTVTIRTNDNCEKPKNTQPQNERPHYWKFRHYDPNGTAERVARILHQHKARQ